MKNHAFLIQAHTQPELVAMILNRLKSTNHYFFIHVDSKFNNYEQFTRFKSSNVMLSSKRYCVNWGAVEQIYLTLELLNLAKFNGIQFDYYHLISGQDYPLLNAYDFDAFFERTNLNYMELDEKNEFLDRFMIFHLNSILNPRNEKYKSITNRIFSWQKKMLACKIRLRPFLPMHPYKGSNWWSLNASAINYILNYVNCNPSYVRRFKYTSCCDEVFFHTILFNSPLKDTIEKFNLRYVEWKRKKIDELLPRLLDENSYGDIMKSGCVFIRKVDILKSLNLLNKISLEDEL